MPSGFYRRYLSNGVSRILGWWGAWPTRRTDVDALEGFIRRLRPVAPDAAMVRLGPERDGGYVLPGDLEGISACFSPGVDIESGFELDCAELGIPVFLADASVDGPAFEHPLFHFTKKFIGSPASGPDYMSMNDWIRAHDSDSEADLLLQMDIEGGEYEVLMALDPTLLKRFRIVIIELHNVHMLLSRPFFEIVRPVFDRLLEHHEIVHLHPNNCCGVSRFRDIAIPRIIELTAYRKDRFTRPPRPTALPHPLDRPNVQGPDIAFSRHWFGGQ